jgi:hypothetical protein
MLKMLDIIIGFTTIILLFSLVVSAIVAAVTGILNTRGAHLRDGIARLLHQLDPTLADPPPGLERTIATYFLCHPMISYNPRRLGDVLQRNEFVRLLLQFAAGEGIGSMPADIQQRLKTIVADNGIADPADVLAKVRLQALVIEQQFPALSAPDREAKALLAIAPAALVAKIHAWYDDTIDRVSASFTDHVRIYTFLASLVIVLAIQLNSVSLINRLSLDDAFRAAAIAQGESFAAHNPLPSAAASGASSAPVTDPSATNPLAAALHFSNILGVPTAGTLREYLQWWRAHFHRNMLGMILSALFLSFGAPFWYNALKNLLQLRSSLSQKDDVIRAARQTDTTDSTDAATTS